MIGGCASGKLQNVDRIVTQTEYVRLPLELPPLPDNVRYVRTIDPPLILTQHNIQAYLDAVDAGTAAPLNHICLTPTDNEAVKENEDRTDRLIRDLWVWVNEVKRRNDNLRLHQERRPFKE